jgi:dihydroorotase
VTGDGDEPLDLVVRGGRVLDPGHRVDARLDVGIRLGRVVAIAPDLSDRTADPKLDYPPSLGTSVVDADGMLVVPGLIDMHAHVYTGVCPLTVPADDSSADAGVTTVVSAGDAGAHTIEGFRRLVVEQNRTRVLAFLHISTIGLAGWPEGEAHDLNYLDVDKAARAVEENRDFVIGIKVREQAPLIVGDNGLEPVRRAVAAGSRAGVPVMVHIGGAPVGLGELMDVLRPGDIVTHCYTAAPNGLIEDGHVIAAAAAARQRGIVFDVGHGYGSFGYDIVGPAVAEGFWPDTISTDLHSLSASGPVVDLPTTMSKFLDLGMPLEEVIRATTATPARVMGRADTLGSLQVGRVADVTVLALDQQDVQFRDSTGAVRTGSQLLRVHSTIRAGVPWRRPSPHPGPTGGSRAWLDAPVGT